MTLMEPVPKEFGWRSPSGVVGGVSAEMTGPRLRKRPPPCPNVVLVTAVVLPGALWKMEEPKRNVAMRSDAMR
jgi:hypothetical protein